MEKKAQYFALNQWLSDYPDDMTYEQVIKILRKDQWGEIGFQVERGHYPLVSDRGSRR
jgi:hypothetical protein